jgi:hypothetical protein
MKYFVELECNDIDVISLGIYKFIKEQGILENAKFGWNFIDCKQLLSHNPELVNFFKLHKLLPRHAAITVVTESRHLPKHVDELPVIAKINIPVINTRGWANRWYVNDTVVAELMDMQLPIVFNSQIEHSVDLVDAEQLPRVIASFTFYNEPMDLLK